VFIILILKILCSDFPLYYMFVIEQVDVCIAPDLDSRDARLKTRLVY
jgi:hypothetical protein